MGLGVKCHAHGGCLGWLRKALVSTGRAVVLLFSTKWAYRNHSSAFVRPSLISCTVGSFQLGTYLLLREA